jgi:hypothetical protein
MLLANTACAEPIRIRYVSLEDVEGVRITDRQKPALKHVQFWASEFPIDYRLERSTYVVRFRIDTDEYLPHVSFEASTKSREPLRIRPRPDRVPYTGRVRRCGTFSDAEVKGRVRFDWVICGANATRDEMVISFDVVSQSDQVVGSEEIPFRLVENGFYLPPDGP